MKADPNWALPKKILENKTIWSEEVVQFYRSTADDRVSKSKAIPAQTDQREATVSSLMTCDNYSLEEREQESLLIKKVHYYSKHPLNLSGTKGVRICFLTLLPSVVRTGREVDSIESQRVSSFFCQGLQQSPNTSESLARCWGYCQQPRRGTGKGSYDKFYGEKARKCPHHPYLTPWTRTQLAPTNWKG